MHRTADRRLSEAAGKVGGVIAAEIFHSLTSRPQLGAFDRIVPALIFTLIGQVITDCIVFVLGDADKGVFGTRGWEPLLSIVVAIALGLCAAGIANTDVLHRFLRSLRLTRETSYPSEWYSTFARHGQVSYIVLHLSGERRLYGYAEEWPSDPKDGHFRIAEAEWLDVGNERVPLAGVAAILVPAMEVAMIEFLPVPDKQAKETD